jgi:type IV pilus assembly protein PilC
MAQYTYTVVDQNGNRISKKVESDSKDKLLSFLLSQGYTIVSIHEDFFIDWKRITSTEIGGLPLKDRVLIFKQLSTMISAGVTIIQAIKILVEQAEKVGLKEKLENVYKQIEGGNSLTEALRRSKGLLSEVQINLVDAGEKSGNLTEMLLRVTEDLEKSKKLRGKITGALIYPAIIFIVLIVVIVVMIVFMVPQIKELYASFGATELPFVTALLVSFGEFISNPISVVTIIFGIPVALVGYRFYISDLKRKKGIDAIKLKFPVFGNLIKKIYLAEFCRVTSMLLKSGVSIVDAVSIVATTIPNQVIKQVLVDAQSDILKGVSFAVSIAKNNSKGVIPEILIKVISTAEESGKIDQVLADMGKYYEDEVEQISSNLTKLLEPFILVLVGGFVAFMAVAIYLPIYQVGNLV